MSTNRKSPVGEILTKEALATRLKIPPGKVDALRKSGKIPCLKFGYRTIRFELEKVLVALRTTEVLAVIE